MDPKEVKRLGDLIKQYGKAAHEAAKKGNHDQADALHQKAEDSLLDLYKHLGITDS